MKIFPLILTFLVACGKQGSVWIDDEIGSDRYPNDLVITRMSDYDVIGSRNDLSRVEHVKFFGNKIDTIPAAISGLPKLKSIDFVEVGKIDWEQVVSVLIRCKSLESINIERIKSFHAPISISQIQGLKWLRVLHVDEVDLDIDLSLFGQLNGLVLFDIKRVRLPSESSVTLSLETLSLYNCRLDSIPEAFLGANGITGLNLTDNPGVDVATVIKQMESYPRLVMLSLAECELHRLPESFVSLRRLKTLSFAANELPSLPDFFSEFDSLTHLDLTRNHFSEFPRTTVDMHSLKYLYLSDNPLGKDVCEETFKGASERVGYVYIKECPLDEVAERCLQEFFPNAELSRER